MTTFGPHSIKFSSISYSIGYPYRADIKEHGYNIYRVKVSHRCSHNIYNPCRKSHSDVDPIWLWWRVSLLPPRHPVCVAGIGFWILQYTESIDWIKEDQAFSPSYDSAPQPTLTLSPSPLSSKLDRRHTGRLRKRDNMLRGEGVGEEPNYTTARKPGPL